MSRWYFEHDEVVTATFVLGDRDTLEIGDNAGLVAYEVVPALAFTGGRATLINHGVITTFANTAIVGHLTTPFDIRIDNSGSITTQTRHPDPLIALSSDEGVGGTLHLRNSGTGSYGGIRAPIDLSALHADRVVIVNTGVVGADVQPTTYAGTGGVDIIRNTGTIIGAIHLGAGDDILRDHGDIAGRIYGEDGDDRISIGAYAREVWGGAGRDVIDLSHGGATVYFDALTDSAPDRAHADVIRGYDKATGDIVSLWRIDADTTTDGDQAFHTIGTSAFSGNAGELRYQTLHGGIVLFADVDGDAQSDFALVVRGHVAGLADLAITL